jgi:hypothetical protein
MITFSIGSKACFARFTGRLGYFVTQHDRWFENRDVGRREEE